MGKWAKYGKTYNPEWEKEAAFARWLKKTPEALLKQGKPQAYCVLCNCTIRAHKNDLMDHKKSVKHSTKERSLPALASSGGTLLSYGFAPKSQESKIIDLKLSTYIACHSSVKGVDHLGELLKDVGNGSKLGDLKLHRTKCSKLISKVISPAMQKDLIADIGDGYFSVIVDESTDNTTQKHMALIVKYFSFPRLEMVTDFLGIVVTPRVTAQVLYTEFKRFMAEVGLSLNKMTALGTDGASNLCGAVNSLFMHLKRNDCPKLVLVKCICHGIDKAVSKACAAFPSSLDCLLRESRNWFAHSALRKFEYAELYQKLTNGKSPPNLVKIGETRFLSWDGAVSSHLEQYMELERLFRSVADGDQKCFMARQLAQLHEDRSHLLYLQFLRPILRDIAVTNIIFQSSVGDFSKVYRDLKTLVLSIAERVLKSEALRDARPGAPGFLKTSEIQALKIALLRDDNFKSIQEVVLGDRFDTLSSTLALPAEKLLEVRTTCKNFLVMLLKELVARLPSCIQAAEQLGNFAPTVALAQQNRPGIRDLPLDLIDMDLDREVIEVQWLKLKTIRLEDICPDEKNLPDVGIIKFWACVYKLENAAGQPIFKELAAYVLSALTLPLSNAVVERVFSVLALVKTKIRNKIGMEMLSSLLRVRTHLQAQGICCQRFQPSQDMIRDFNSARMYDKRKKKNASAAGDQGRDAAVGGGDEEFEVDDPEEVSEVGDEDEVLEGGDIDDTAPVPHFDEMLELLAEVDALLL